MSELQSLIEKAYQTAKSGEWGRLLSEWENSAVLAKRCSRYSKPGSSWSFLHQAAYFGNERACRVLIGLGASTEAQTHESLTPAEVAAQKGHHEVAAFPGTHLPAETRYGTRRLILTFCPAVIGGARRQKRGPTRSCLWHMAVGWSEFPWALRTSQTHLLVSW